MNIEVQIWSHGYWADVGIYYVQTIPRIGERVSVTGKILQGYFHGPVSEVIHDFDSGFITIRIGSEL